MGIKIKLNRQFNTSFFFKIIAWPTQSCLLVSVNALRHYFYFVK